MEWDTILEKIATADLNVILLIVISIGLLVLAILLMRAATRSKEQVAPLTEALTVLTALGERVEALGIEQTRVSRGLAQFSDLHTEGHARTVQVVQDRIEWVSGTMGKTLGDSTERTAGALGELRNRLETIDKAQENIEELSGEVRSLQNILANRHARGSFGETQLKDIVEKALPPEMFTFQETLSNNKRVDCLLLLPEPPGRLAVDAKFPLEGFNALCAAKDNTERRAAASAFKQAVSTHLKDIQERYIVPRDTADSALMFLPSEAVYAEIHARFPELIRESFERKVWIVSPSTLMATLQTLRGILRDIRIKHKAADIRKELNLLNADLKRLDERVDKLATHLRQANQDIHDITTSKDKAMKRASRLEQLEFGDAPEPSPAADEAPFDDMTVALNQDTPPPTQSA